MEKNKKRRIIGIDPGLANTGFGIIDDFFGRLHLVSYGVIQTSSEVAHSKRLLKIHENLLKVIEEFKPNEAAMEELYFGKNSSSAMTVAEAKGVSTLAIAQNDLKLFMYRPNQIKSAVTGTQGSKKDTVEKYVALVLNLAEIPKPDHAADALAAAITHAHYSAGKFA